MYLLKNKEFYQEEQQRIAEEHLQIAAEIGRTNNISLSKLQELLTLFYMEDAYRLGAFQFVRKRLDAFHIQLHNHTDSDWCLCIGRFSVLPLLLRQFQELCTVKSWQE